MGGRKVLADLLAAGLRIEVADGRLRVQPAELLTDDLRGAIRAHKPELIALISQESPPATPTAAPAAAVAAAWRRFMASVLTPSTTTARPYRL